MSRQPLSRSRPADHILPSDFPEPQLQQHSWEQDTITIAASVPRLPPNASIFELESSARRAIGSLIKRLREAGGDPAQITRTRICVSDTAYGAVLAAVRDEILHPRHAIHSIFLMNDDSQDAFVTEIDAVGLAN
jgi:enamine deaminase RidA (YjgF/YER057c/UK114 family)